MPTADDVAEIDPLKFREVMGHYPTGVAVVTGIADDGEAIAMVVGTFSSVSLDPPLAAFMPTKGSFTYGKLRTSEGFTVNILANDQEGLCRQLARPAANKLADIAWTPSINGSPVLEGVVATIDCSFHSITDAGDHDIVLGAVQNLQVRRPVTPLLFFQGGYGGFVPRSLMVSYDKELANAVTLAQKVRFSMENLCAITGAEVTAYARVGDDIATVATVVSEGMNHTATLGSRFPLMLPMGELFIAWENEEEQAKWIAKAVDIDDEARDFFVGRLEVIRERGWSYSLSADNDQELIAAISDYNDAELTPAGERAIAKKISAAISRYQEVDLDDLADADSLTSVVVPVKDAQGRVQLVLRLAQLPANLDEAVLRRWVNEMRKTAAEASTSISAGN